MKATLQNVAVKSFLALERGQQWATSGELTHRKAFIMGAALAAAMMAGGALATAPTGGGTVDTNGGKNPIDMTNEINHHITLQDINVKMTKKT